MKICNYCAEYFPKWSCGANRDTGECDCPKCQGMCECQEEANDKQEGGTHYKEMDVQPWDVVDTWSREQRIGYYRGGVLKYIMRMGSKDFEAQEIAKARHYCEKLYEVLTE